MNTQSLLENKLHEIHASLKNHVNYKKIRENYITYDMGLLPGLFGISNFFIRYDAYFKTDDSSEFLQTIFSTVFESIPSLNKSYASGISGLLFQIEMFSNSGIIDKNDFELDYEAIDEVLLAFSESSLSKNNIDPLYGGLSPLPYFIEAKSLSNLTKELELLLGASHQTALSMFHWFNTESTDRPVNYSVMNAGLAHGLPAILYLFLKIKHVMPNDTRIDKVVYYLLDFILKHKQTGNISLFPQEFGETKHTTTRLAWCYGDLTIANTILLAGKIYNNQSLIDEAVGIMLFNTQRKNLKENLVVDAGICHGTSGIAYLFNRFYYETGKLEFKESSIYWMEKTLEMSVYPDGVAGFKAYKGGNYGFYGEYGLLEGVAGIGLVMLSFSSKDSIYRDWDKIIFLS